MSLDVELLHRQLSKSSELFIFPGRKLLQILPLSLEVRRLMKQNKMAATSRRTLPKIRILRLMTGSLRPWHWQMTFYLFLFRPQLAQQAWRWQLTLSANQWRVSLERISQAELLSLRASHPTVLLPGRQHLRLVTNKVVTPLNEPEVEIIPLAPVWREAA